MRKIIFTLFAAGFTNLVSAAVPPLKTQIVASGFDRPLFATAPSGDPRLFVVERGGLIKVLQNGAVLPTPFLDLSAKVDTAGERGLLGMAFDPGFETQAVEDQFESLRVEADASEGPSFFEIGGRLRSCVALLAERVDQLEDDTANH